MPNPRLSTLTPAGRSFHRLQPRLLARCQSYAQANPADWAAFSARLEANFEHLFDLLLQLYGGQYDFFYHLEELLVSLAEGWMGRSAEMKTLDRGREQEPAWYQSNQMVGGVCYVDLFGGNLAGVRARIPYFKEEYHAQTSQARRRAIHAISRRFHPGRPGRQRRRPGRLQEPRRPRRPVLR